MSTHDYHHAIPDQVFEDISLSQLTSIKENSFDELTHAISEGNVGMLFNPEVTHYELQHELSIPEQLFGELIRVLPLFISIAIGAYAIHLNNFLWLVAILLIPLVYFFRNFIVPLSRFVLPVLLFAVLLSLFIFQNQPALIGSSCLLASCLWLYGNYHYKSARLTKKAFSSETKFIELYFRNVFLLYRSNRVLNSAKEVQGFIDYSYKHHPPKLSGKEMLYYCKRCFNRTYSQEKGILCGLTNAKPNFENECPDFDHDVERALYEDSILATRLDWISDSQFTIQLVPYLLYGAGAVLLLSEVNFWYSGMFFSAFKSGITDWLYLKELYQPGTPMLGLIVPGLLIITGILSSTGKKWAFIMGFLVFFLDTAFTLFALNGTITWWIHLSIIATLFAGVKEIDNVKAFTKSLIGNG